MGTWVIVGAVVGAVTGFSAGGVIATLVFAVVGAAVGAFIGRQVAGKRAPEGVPQAPVHRASTAARSPGEPEMPANALRDNALLERLEAIDARLARIEAQLRIAPLLPSAAVAPAADTLQPDSPPRAALAPAAAPRSLHPAPSPDVEPDLAVDAARSARSDALADAQPAADALASPRASADAAVSPVAAPVADGNDLPPPRPDYGVRVADAPAVARSEPSLLWRWITGGNALTRVGIVILFFGVAFLLRYFAEIVTVPIGLKLAGAAAGGIALAATGLLLARRRPAYGLSLQGAGMGIVYLTVFAAFRLYGVLGPPPATVLLAIVAMSTVWMALRHDSQALAALALSGGFLAPVLIRTGAGSAALLFGYFAVLNAAIFALAWRRAWRPLNVLGFAFTFALGLLWGRSFYTPAHYAIVQPYLALFFAFYVGIAILYARRDPLDVRAPVDGVLVFGVPIVGFALQMAIVRGYRYGVAWSATGVATIYGVLWLWLRRSAHDGLALLSRTFAALAVIFATAAIPFAVDPRETAAWWALEAAGVYALGVVQRQPLARAFALLLQLGAAVAFAIDGPVVDGTLILNARFLGMTLIGAAALASTWAADRHPDHVGERERGLLPWLFAWGAAWWIGAGVVEMQDRIRSAGGFDAALAWVVASSALAIALQRLLRWRRLLWLASALLPVTVYASLRDIDAERTTLTHAGWLVWPLAWVVQWLVLYAAERAREPETARAATLDDEQLAAAHGVSAIALVAWASWELAEWAGRWTPANTAWPPSALVIPALLLLLVAMWGIGSVRWPFARHAVAYGRYAGQPAALFAFGWLLVVNFASTGDAAPLPYLPVLNPLDLTLVAALGTLASWDRAFGRHPSHVRFAWLGAAALLSISAAVVRTAHHWGDVPWQFDALMAYRPLQAALTLTWTTTALALMVYATRGGVRAPWLVGAALLGVVVLKLFAVDLAALSGLTRVVAFMGVGLLLLVIGYVTPLPPAAADGTAAPAPDMQA